MALHQAPTENYWSTTLNGTINNSVTTITLNSTSGLQAPGFLVIDREDGNGVATPGSREVISFTDISGSDITGVTRGDDGSNAGSHNDGALVESVMTVGLWNSLRDNLLSSLATISTQYSTNLFVDSAFISQASVGTLDIDNLNTDNALISQATIGSLRISTYLNASGASIDGVSTTGGLNALWELPGSLPTTLSDSMGTIPITTSYTADFMNLTLRTPSSQASTVVTVKKYPSTTLGIVEMLAGATFASSASFSSTALSAGDLLIADLTTARDAEDLTLVLRAT